MRLNALVRPAAIYALALVVLCAIVTIFPYEYFDSDSSCYSSISQKLASRPLGEWCAPQWWGHGGNHGLFRDHPPGIFWLPALMVRLGVKGNIAALCANYIYLLLGLFFLFKLTSHWTNAAFGWGAVFGLVVTPIFLQYLIRANQEHPLNLAVLAGAYGLSRSGESWRYKGLYVLALVFAVFIKGIGALTLFFLGIVYWIIISRKRTTFRFLVFSYGLALAAAVIFEFWFWQITRTNFWPSYFLFQKGQTLKEMFNPFRFIYSFVWYAARSLWFSFPWALMAVYGGIRLKAKKLHVFDIPLMKFLFFGSLVITLFFSLFERKADRYIFSVYVFLVVLGVFMLLRLKPRLVQFIADREKWLPLVLSAVLIIFSLLRIYFHLHHYRFIRIWSR